MNRGEIYGLIVCGIAYAICVYLMVSQIVVSR